jgi:hypothetical protein
MLSRRWLAALVVALPLCQGGQVFAQGKQSPVIFGALEAANPTEIRAQAEAWLKGIGKTDAATAQKLQGIWAKGDRSLMDRLADTLGLGDAEAARILADAADPLALAPTKVPEILKDAKRPAFFRANLALTYARHLSNRRVHEEALEALKLTRPEDVVDPAAYLFHRAVCEHAMLQKDPASLTIGRLLEDTPGAPERYRAVGALMLLDMQGWRQKDLGDVARKMGNVERRLELARGGPHTQKLQKEIVLRLDELIKELENKAKKSSSSNGGSCPNGGQPSGGPPNGNNPTSPATESGIATGGGPGHVNQRKFRDLQERWGNLPERDRQRALQDLTAGLSSTHREAIENYFRKLAQR